jgi:glucose-1-phosphate cytidylyltransferase
MGDAMKVVLLAGGFGTRLSEYTGLVPKPMLPIGGRPILWHIMRTYARHGHRDFLVALGYKSEVVKEYFLHYRSLNSDFTIDLATGAITPHSQDDTDWRVSLIDTGEQTMTGGRLRRLREYIGSETFMLTYGDGVANIDISRLVDFHRRHVRMVTVSAVRPKARFGELELDGDTVTRFEEKPQLHEGWINGGFFVIEPGFLDFIDDDSVMLEREPMERAAREGQLMSYRHDGFWQCMDTKRDLEGLEQMWARGDAPWK